MRVLIDGYNVLFAAGILGRNIGPGTLERARNALLGVLARSLDESDRLETTVVFDSGDPPPGLPHQTSYRGITVRFAADHEHADALIMELIRANSAPRRLVVVSSDREIQRAAKRRRASAVAADDWFDELKSRRAKRADSAASPEKLAPPEKPTPTEDESELAAWREVFKTEFRDSDAPDREVFNPFPPGYASDLSIDEGDAEA